MQASVRRAIGVASADAASIRTIALFCAALSLAFASDAYAAADPSLSLVKTADNPGACSLAGATLNYSYLVTNTGNVTISGPITVDDDIASGESCPAGDLAPGGSTTCTASYVVTQADVDAGSVTNNASATGTDPGGATVTSNLDNEAVICVQNPALSLVKTRANPDACTLVGATLYYAYDVTNVGNVTIHQPITIDDDLATNASCLGFPASLLPGDTIVCTSSYQVSQADVDRGWVTNVASATGRNPLVTSNLDDATVLCAVAFIPGDVDGDGDVDLDDLGLTVAALNDPASGPDDPRDLDGDGLITILDARQQVLLCTRARCEVETGATASFSLGELQEILAGAPAAIPLFSKTQWALLLSGLLGLMWIFRRRAFAGGRSE